jgi:hypothetical protein
MNILPTNQTMECNRKLIEEIDSALLKLESSKLFHEQTFSSLISRQGLDQCGYREAFPQLLFDVTTLKSDDSSWSLAPAVCYHAFLSFKNSLLKSPQRVTARSRCFRNEEYVVPGRRQIEFEMREFILIGEPYWLESQLETWQTTISSFAKELGIIGRWQSAIDPFFLPLSKGRALMQRLLNTKLEFCLEDGLAIASINRHRKHFTERLSIEIENHEVQTPDRKCEDRSMPHSACIAFGLDRWAQARRMTYSKSAIA